MKKSLDRDFDPGMDDRDRTAVEALEIESVEPRNRKRRNLLLACVVVLVASVVAVGFVSRSAGLAASSPSAPPLPTPIAWSDKIVAPTPIAPASAMYSHSPGDPAPTQHLRTTLTLQMQVGGGYWQKSHGNHFTLVLSNATRKDVPLEPCPTYRMYITGTDITAAPVHELNCAAIGHVLAAGSSVTLDMVYQPAAADPEGKQILVWSWVSPEDYQALQKAGVFIAP
jgi:hypothetical protein